MSDTRKLTDARSLLRVSASVQTYKGPGDQRVFTVSPAGFCHARMFSETLQHPTNMTTLDGRIVVWAQNADEGTRLLTALSDAALPKEQA